MRAVIWVVAIVIVCMVPSIVMAQGSFATPVASADLDPAAYTQWMNGVESPVAQNDGPWHVVWTQSTAPVWDGVNYGEGNIPGARYLRIGFKSGIPVGSILVCDGGQLSVLKPNAPYPGNVLDDTQWIPAQRLLNRQVSTAEVGWEQYALWVLPPTTVTRAVRFKHSADITDKTYAGWLGGMYVLRDRYVNVAPQGVATTYKNQQTAELLNNESHDGAWGAWDNWDQGDAQGDEPEMPVLSPEHPGWLVLSWPRPVTLSGLNALWAGIGAVDVQVYTGPATRHPSAALETDWQTIQTFDHLTNQYPLALGVNWLAFTRPVTTRAVRLRITQATQASHPHLESKIKGGKRIWLGELLALQALGTANLATAILPEEATTDLGHPPIPVRFTLKDAGYVTLVIEDQNHKRIRNLVSETYFPAGKNVAWWDGQDDLGRDVEASHHGLYSVPGSFVAPGAYQVRGLFYKKIDLRYEFSIYTGGYPAWATADGSGAWLANHTPPSSALYVPADRTPTGKPLVYLGSYISEGTPGLAWVDLTGKKVGGENWVGGEWTGAPYLACDTGAKADTDTCLYAGAAWDGEVRLTAITRHGDKTVTKYHFEKKELAALTGLAVHDGLLIASLPKVHLLLFVDVHTGTQLGSYPLDDPRGLAFDGQGRLLVLTGTRLLRYTLPTNVMELTAPDIVIAQGLEDPQHVTLDQEGNFYISDLGKSHQVKVFSPDGALLRRIGHAGAPHAGPYDQLHMNNPNGLSIDRNNHLWVAETDYQPKRVSEWTLDGTLVKAFYGPSEYGGGGRVDARDKSLLYYHGMEFKLDWAKGTDQLQSVFLRPGPETLPMPAWNELPDQAIYCHGRKYFTNCYCSNPTNGAGVAIIWLERDGVVVPVAALGSANNWELLKSDAMKPRWPAGCDLKGEYWHNQSAFCWVNLKGDGNVTPNDVQMVWGNCGGVTVMPDLAIVVTRLQGRTLRFAPTRFTEQGVPVYDFSAGQVLATDVIGPVSSGGDQALVHANGWTVLTCDAPKSLSPYSLCGVYQGEPRWSYPNMWPGLHPSHESPAPEMLGELIGTTRLLGGFVEAPDPKVGPLWSINGNMGAMYLFTADGLFVATLFHDSRQGKSWSMPAAVRNMSLNDVSCSDENFWPSMTQTVDGKVYLVDGSRSSLVRVDGLDTLQRLPDAVLRISATDLKAAQAFFLQREALRQQAHGTEALTVAIRATAPVVDGKLDGWKGAEWVSIDKRGQNAWFNSNSKPYDVSGAVLVAGDRLYAAFRTADSALLSNSGDVPKAPFKTGGALDLMLGTDPNADPTRSQPVPGDERLLVTMVKGKVLALLYRAVVPGTKEPVPFSSPWRTVTIDRVDDVSDQVQLAGADGNYELSVSLAALHLSPQPGMKIKADIGILRGDGFHTLQRVYWTNKATGITADVPSEAMLTPALWGVWQFATAP